MQVELLIARTGPGMTRGSVVELDEQEARRLVDAGKAKPVSTKPKGQSRKKATTESDEER